MTTKAAAANSLSKPEAKNHALMDDCLREFQGAAWLNRSARWAR